MRKDSFTLLYPCPVVGPGTAFVEDSVSDQLHLDKPTEGITLLNLKNSITATLLAAASIGAFAQNAATPRVDQREANQQARIANGAASGELTGKETVRLGREQATIHKAATQAKADGTVTRRERKRLHRMQNASSRGIHHQKHDAQTAK